MASLWYFVYFFKRFRSFNTVDMSSVGQRASKLPDFKVGGLKKKSATRPQHHLNQSAQVRLWPGSNHSQSLMAGNFVAFWPIHLKFLELRNLSLFKTLKSQVTSSILRMAFALSKTPHFNSVYLLRVPSLTGIDVL